MNNYNKYWKNWNVLQTPKIDFDLLAEDGWEVYDVDLNGNHSTIARNKLVAENTEVVLRADYSATGGVNMISASRGEEMVYSQMFNFLLKPSVGEIQKVLESVGINDWRKYYTAC